LRVSLSVIAVAALVGLLYLARLYNYNLFHSLAEIFSVCVAFAVFAIAWNSRRFARNDSLLFIGVTLAFVAITDLLHLLSYKGMGVFESTGSDLPTQLWLVGRYQFTLAFLLLPTIIRRGRAPFVGALAGFFMVTVGLYVALLAFHVFPTAFIEDQGLTTFKKLSEYVVCALLVIACGLLYRQRAHLAPSLLWLLDGALLVTVASELCFTLYIDPYGHFNLIGHFLKIVAFYLLYKAMVETTLVRPYGFLFRELQERGQELVKSESKFRSTFEQAAVGMALVDSQGRLLLVNERLAVLLGYNPEELKRLILAALVHVEDRAADLVLIRDVLAGRTTSAVRQARLMRKGGDLIWARLTVSPVHDVYAAPEQALLVIEDITESKRADREREELLARLEGVGDVTNAAMQSLELNELMRNILARVAWLMKADVAAILLKRGDRLVSLASIGLDEEVRRSFSLAIGEGYSGGIAATGRPQYLADAQNDPRVVSQAIKDKGVRSMLGVPLRRGDQLLGVLHVDWLAQRPFDEGEVLFLELVADRVSLALFNADLYTRQREVAQVLQQEMVAVPETIPGLRFGHAYRSATEGANVGGDFYDIFPVDDSRVWVVIGDVSGHGIEAATTASLIREITRALTLDDLEPAVVMRKLNRAVIHRLDFRHFATMFIGRLDRRTGDLDYCSAGHPPAYLLRDDGRVERLLFGNFPVGALLESGYEGHRITLGQGDKLVLYTDGVLEARSGSYFFGEERLAEVLMHAAAPEIVPEQVLAAVDAFSKGRLVDDLAVVCISPT
jgi:PAS domain S-box-containing protein